MRAIQSHGVTDNPRILEPSKVSLKYVAVIDILGFSSRVLANFTSALETFEQVLDSVGHVRTLIAGVELRIYSDSYLLISDSLPPVVRASQGLLMQTLFNDYLVRGGIASGQHIDVSHGGDVFMVSEAVVKAATLEKTIKYPCIAVHPDTPVSDDWWSPAPRNLDRGLLYFGGVTVVNPCNVTWGTSAATRVLQMLEANPAHREKYEWFLELHQAIFSPVPMVPPRFFAQPSDTE